ncbi:MAG: hypothetical protein KDI19_07895 [Pseudomonadales bacterium]|nr:hypothetical protein [Pseudomonadales bacterium]
MNYTASPAHNRQCPVDKKKQARLRLASELARDTQHQFNNVMAAAFGYTNLLVSRGGESDIGEHLLATLGRANKLLEGFFFLIRDARQDVTQVDVGKVVEDVRGMLEIFPAGKLKIEGELPDPCISLVSKHALYHALLQLCITARENTGELVATVRAASPDWTDAVDDCLCVRVAVAGRDGPFLPVDDVAPEPDLEVCLDILRECGGVLARSDAGFELAIPRYVESHVLTDPGLAGLVLLIDGDEDNLRVHREAIEDTGHTVIDTTDGVVALDIFEKQPDEFSFVIAGGSAGGLDPVTILARAKALRPIIRTVTYGGGGSGSGVDFVAPDAPSWETILLG